MAGATQEERRARRTESRVPRFEDVEDEAGFWDTHSLADFEDELEAVDDVEFVRAGPKKSITVRLEPDLLADLTDLARAKGIARSALVRAWIVERLRGRPGSKPSRASPS